MKYIFRKKINIIFAALFDALGFFLFSFFLRKNKKLKTNPRTVLIIRLDHLGDVLFSTAVPKVIKENFEKSKVLFLTSSWGAPLLQNNPFIDQILIFDAPWFAKKRYKRSPESLSFFGLIRTLRKMQIDIAVGLRGDLRENAIMFFGGAKERIGYGVTGGSFFLTKEVPYRKLGHESERALELLKTVGVKEASLDPKIYFSENEETPFLSKLSALGFEKDKKCIGLQVNAGTSAKEWSAESFSKLIDECAHRFPAYQIILIGSDENKAEQLINGLDRRVINLAGRTSVRELCYLLKKMSIFIGLDSGPTHVAAALGVPTIFLFSGTNVFEQWKSQFENVTILRHRVACSPCHLEVCNVVGHPCMSKIKPEEVISALEGRLR